MIKHIFKIIWKQRRSNGWLFAELVVVLCAIWYMADRYYVDLSTYYSPLGYDITDTWRFKLDNISPESDAYVAEEDYKSDETADLLRLMEQIRLNPKVEEVCATFYSCPYSFGNSWRQFNPVDGDTAVANAKPFQVRYVTKEYFSVFRVKNKDGKAIGPGIFDGHTSPAVITEDMERAFYHSESGKGRQIGINSSGGESFLTVAEVCKPVRSNDYSRAEPSFFFVMQNAELASIAKGFGAAAAELCVRMKQSFSQDGMYAVMEEMNDRLTVNNLSVYGVSPISYYRDIQISGKRDGNRNQMALTVFLLVNVFFGIIGTFWLRTQSRRGEIGLRIALGSSRAKLGQLIYGEGLCILAMTVPIVLLFAANLFYLDIPDTYKVPLSAGRILVTVGGTYLLLAAMICLGIWLPVRKAEKIPAAEALHYE